MYFLTVTLGLLFALSLTLFHGLIRKLSTGRKKLPPGPRPLPLIGSLHLLGDQPHKSLSRLANTYGPLLCLRLGFINTVVISSPDMAKEVLKNQDLAFSSRAIPDAIHAHDQSKYSSAFLPVGPRWRGIRKAMNTYIFSSSSLDATQQLRRQKVQELITYCRESSETGAAVNMSSAAFRTTLNVLSNTFFSMDLTDPFSDSATEFKELVWNIMVEAGKPNLVDLFPIFRRFDPQGIRRNMGVHFGKVIGLFNGLIDERLEKGNSDQVAHDVIDALLAAAKERPEEIDRIQIEHMCLDLFTAGTDTTSSTLEWAMSEALRNPETMKKAKSELEEVIGKGKAVEEADISRLPYLRCMMKETLRIHPPVPLLIPRKVEQDVDVCGYTVRKNSQVLVNVWAIGRDPKTWENPLEFKPERFYESEVDVRGRDFELIPFGAGRRICPGLPLATRILPVMLGSLLNSFDWKLEGGTEPHELDMEEKFGFSLQKAHPLRAVPYRL